MILFLSPSIAGNLLTTSLTNPTSFAPNNQTSLRNEIVRIGTLELNPNYNMGDKINLQLFNNLNLEAQVRNANTSDDGGIFWSGDLTDGSMGTVNLYLNNGLLNGSIYRGNRAYVLQPLADNSIQVKEIDLTLLENENESPEIPEPKAGPRITSQKILSPSAPDPLVDVLIIYSRQVRDEFSSIEALENEIDLRIAELNQVFTNSEINITVRLAHSQMVTSISNSANSATRDVSNNSTAQNLRDEYGADLVSFWQTAGANGSGNIYDGTSDRAFNTVKLWNVQERFGFVHEMGHNFDARHDRATYINQGNNVSRDEYNYGYVFNFMDHGVERTARTVMSYDDFCNNPCIRLPYLSNPNINSFGLPLGVPVDNRDSDPRKNAAYNALAISLAGPDVEGFRTSLLPLPITKGGKQKIKFFVGDQNFEWVIINIMSQNPFITDIKGKVIKKLIPKSNSLYWNKRNSKNQLVSNGMYFLMPYGHKVFLIH